MTKRRDWTLYFLGILVAACIAVILFFAAKPAAADTTITIIGPSEVLVERDGIGVYNGFAIWQADFTTACHASPPDKQLQVGFPAGGETYSGWVNAGCDYGPGFDAVHLIAADGTHWLDSGEGYVASTTWDGLGDGIGSVWLITRAATTRHPGDFNRDAAVDSQDIFDFLAAWFDSSPAADLNGSAACDVGDIFDFLRVWHQ